MRAYPALVLSQDVLELTVLCRSTCSEAFSFPKKSRATGTQRERVASNVRGRIESITPAATQTDRPRRTVMTRVQMFHPAVNRRLALAGFAAALMATSVFRPTAAYSVTPRTPKPRRSFAARADSRSTMRCVNCGLSIWNGPMRQSRPWPTARHLRRHRSATDAEPGRYRRRYQALLWRCSW